MVFYAVANGKTIGIFLNWNDCKNSVVHFKNAKYKKFNTQSEAEDFIRENQPENATIEEHNLSSSVCDDFVPDYFVYTDGACSNNGRANAKAGIGIYFGMDDQRNVSQKLDGKQTNNSAELTAIIETYNIIENDILNGKKIAIVTDSEYAIKCVSGYGEKCSKQNWIKAIPNKELVQQIYENFTGKSNVKFIHINAHTNNADIHSIGNDNADKLANKAIGLEHCPYNNIK